MECLPQIVVEGFYIWEKGSVVMNMKLTAIVGVLSALFGMFFTYPKIDKVERIDGDTMRHIVHASALNYSAHHGDAPFDRIHITLTDTPENGVKINKVTIQKGISEKESTIQCRRES